MSTWNYRLVRETVEVPGMAGATEDRIHVIEAYYADADDTLTMWCPAGAPEGDSREDVAANLRLMLEATAANVPILPAASLPGYDSREGIAGRSTDAVST